MIKNKILFNNPTTVSNEIRNISKLNYFSSNGKYSKRCSGWLKKNIKCKEALLVNSCTAALEMSAILINIKPKDEIIMPSFTFVSTANAFVLHGGVPVFVDIDPGTLNINPKNIIRAITKKTKAIVIVHYAGISCDIDPIIKIAKKYKLIIIEDAAQAILSKYKNRPLGSIGDLATLSFHETKNIHCGEGGALLINNPKFIKRAKVIRDKGTNRDLFNQNMVKKYTWIDYGSSYGLSEINAAFLYSQLKQAKKINEKRIGLFNQYHKILNELEIRNLIKRPTVPKYAKHNGHIYYIILKSNRDKLIKFLKKRGINSVFHYIPLHSSPFGKGKTNTKLSMKNTNNAGRRLLRLPIHTNIKASHIERIGETISDFFNVKN
jgi:dTDP-4-amino-4,6-dideoxygalactose transaminase